MRDNFPKGYFTLSLRFALFPGKDEGFNERKIMTLLSVVLLHLHYEIFRVIFSQMFWGVFLILLDNLSVLTRFRQWYTTLVKLKKC